MKKEDIDDIVLKGMSTNIPKMKELILEFFERKEINKGMNIRVNPETAVAYGAGYQIYSIKNNLNQIILWDIISLPIKIKINNQQPQILFDKGTKIPNSETKEFKIEKEKLSIIVFQEELTYSKEKDEVYSYDCDIGEYIIEGIQNQTIKVTFKIDVNSLLSVEFKDSEGKIIKAKKNEMYKKFNEDEIKLMKEKVNEFNRHIRNQEKVSKLRNSITEKKIKNKDDEKLKKALDFLEKNKGNYIELKEISKKLNELKIDDINLTFD